MEVFLSAPDDLGNLCTTTNQNLPLSIFQSCTRPIAQALRVCDVAAEAGVVEAAVAGEGGRAPNELPVDQALLDSTVQLVVAEQENSDLIATSIRVSAVRKEVGKRLGFTP